MRYWNCCLSDRQRLRIFFAQLKHHGSKRRRGSSGVMFCVLCRNAARKVTEHVLSCVTL